MAALLAAEPGLLARRAAGRRWQPRYRWEFAARPDTDPVRVAAYTDQADLDRQRDAFVSLPPPLDSAPPFLLLLASGPDGDHLLLNAHHARVDGLACLRLLTELGTAYGRQAGAAGGAGRPGWRAGRSGWGARRSGWAARRSGWAARSAEFGASAGFGAPAALATQAPWPVPVPGPAREPRGRVAWPVARIAPGQGLGPPAGQAGIRRLPADLGGARAGGRGPQGRCQRQRRAHHGADPDDRRLERQPPASPTSRPSKPSWPDQDHDAGRRPGPGWPGRRLGEPVPAGCRPPRGPGPEPSPQRCSPRCPGRRRLPSGAADPRWTWCPGR